MALKMLGHYMSESYTENRLVIISDYFLSSIALLKSVERNEEDNNSIMDTYDKLARFADREYQQVNISFPVSYVSQCDCVLVNVFVLFLLNIFATLKNIIVMSTWLLTKKIIISNLLYLYN